jgi:hypothetical protein
VGFGDCFLFTFHYRGRTGDRHMLIDFGSTQHPPNARAGLKKAIANDIAAVVGKPLHVLVATHRHADHINGFALSAAGKGTGAIIAGLEPQLVVQPWTERADAPRQFKGKGPKLMDTNAALRQSLGNMAMVAQNSLREAGHLPAAVARAVRFIATDGVENLSAIKNLARMGEKTKAAYVQYGSKLPAIRTLLPGVTISVLGPPTITQKADVLKQNPRNTREYWHFTSFWRLRASTSQLAATVGTLFPDAPVFASHEIPIENRWFVRRVKTLRGGQLLRIVRAMDDALNNTSVILLIEAGKKKMLFPGDAQWENWELALKKDGRRLRGVDVYKVGHHGSLNATPKTLWEGFKKRSTDAADPRRLRTVMSTRSDSKHGSTDNDSEVPRQKLVRALRKNSTLRSTQELEGRGDLVMTLEFDLTK